MRFDIGTLDSGERSLSFGLLVFLLTDRCLVNCNQYEDEYAELEFSFAMIKVFWYNSSILI